LHHGRTVHIYDGHQARAGTQHHISWVFRPPIFFKCDVSPCFGFESEKFREFFNTERTASDYDALEETMRILPIFAVDVQ
jgi:hypothetical protein